MKAKSKTVRILKLYIYSDPEKVQIGVSQGTVFDPILYKVDTNWEARKWVSVKHKAQERLRDYCGV